MKFPFLPLVLVFLGYSSVHSENPTLLKTPAFQTQLNESGIPLAVIQNLSAEQFLELTPNKIKKATGHRLGLKSAFALKKIQKLVKKELNPGGKTERKKDQMVALLLCIFLGFLGIHRFYLGYPLIGIIQLLTLGMCGIWYLIDFFRICFGDLKPKNGVYDPEL